MGRHRAAQPRGDPVAQLLGGLAGEGQRQHLSGAAPRCSMRSHDRLDQRRGLAGAGAGEHEQRPALRGRRRAAGARRGVGTSADGVRAHEVVRRRGPELMGATQPSGADSSVDTSPVAPAAAADGWLGAMTDGPLSDLLVLDLTRALAGPHAAMMLGDMGARVIKVESPTGDDTRGWGPPFIGDGGRARVDVLPLHQPQQGVAGPRPEDRRRTATCWRGWSSAPTC